MNVHVNLHAPLHRNHAINYGLSTKVLKKCWFILTGRCLDQTVRGTVVSDRTRPLTSDATGVLREAELSMRE